MIRSLNWQLFVVLMALAASLVPYADSVPITIGYAVSVLFLVGASVAAVTDRSILTMTYRGLLFSPWFWVYAGVTVASQIGVAFRADLGARDLLRAAGYPVLFGLAYFVLAPAAAKYGRRLWLMLGGLVTLGNVLGVIAALVLRYGLYQPEWPIPVLGVSSVKSIFIGPNYFAIVSFVGLGCAYLGVVSAKSSLTRFSWVVAAGVNLVAVLLSYSRAAYLAIALGALAAALARSRRRLASKAVLAGVVLALVGFVGVRAIRYEPVDRFLEIDRKLTGRGQLWPAAIEAIGERPIFGWGFGNVGEVVRKKVGHWASSHNTFLDWGLTTGVPGLIVLVGLMLASAKGLFTRTGRPAESRFLEFMLVGLVVQSLFITFTPGGAGFGSVVFTIILGEANLRRWMAAEDLVARETLPVGSSNLGRTGAPPRGSGDDDQTPLQ